jgi:HK97 family phage prohead protease
MAGIEHRACMEVRAIGRQLRGVAVPYNTVAHVHGFDEVVRPGAFADSLRENDDILLLLDHDMTRVLARSKSNSLRLAETSRGLEFEADVNGTSWASDAIELVRSGSAGGMSFGFKVRSAGEMWEKTTRELRSLDLVEISVVSAFPVYSNTEVQARSRRQTPHLNVAMRYLETV